MEELYKLKEMLCEELEKYGEKELTAGSLDVVDKLAHALKNVDKIIENKDEYSGDYRGSYRRGGSYRNGSYRDGRSYRYDGAQRRDSRGRYMSNGYSRHGDLVSELRDLMEDAPDENTRMEFQRLISKMEGM